VHPLLKGSFIQGDSPPMRRQHFWKLFRISVNVIFYVIFQIIKKYYFLEKYDFPVTGTKKGGAPHRPSDPDHCPEKPS
jgi:hypothetical protein